MYTQTSNGPPSRLRRALRGWLLGVVCAGACAVAAPPAAAQGAADPQARAQKRAHAVRTLEAVNIEGEIAVPQVLFITSRDYRRFRDGLGAAYRATALDVARAIDRPSCVRVVAMTADNKEDGK